MKIIKWCEKEGMRWNESEMKWEMKRNGRCEEEIAYSPEQYLGYRQFALSLGGSLALISNRIKDSHLKKQANERQWEVG